MRKMLLSLAAAAVVHVTAFAQDSWKVDPLHSRLGFSIAHLGIAEVTGAFKAFDLTITGAKADFSDAVFELTVDVASIDTAVTKRDDHLKSPDFFDAARYPKMTFKSARLTPAGKNRYKLEGDLAMHGVTRPVTAELWYRGTINNQGKTTAGFQLTATLKRSDFGIGPRFTPPMIGDEVTVKADGEFIKN